MISEERFERIMSTIHSDNLRRDEAINQGLSEDELPLQEATLTEVNESIDFVIGLLDDLANGIDIHNKMEKMNGLIEELRERED